MYENVTDKVFLLDTKQAQDIFENKEILGEDYCLARTTPEAFKYSGYIKATEESRQKYDVVLNSDKPTRYILRTPFGWGYPYSFDAWYGSGISILYVGLSEQKELEFKRR